MTTVTTTLQAIRDAGACKHGYRKLRAHLGSDWPMDKRFNVLRVLRSNGRSDALWVLTHASGNNGIDVWMHYWKTDWSPGSRSGDFAKWRTDLLRRLLAPT